MAQSENRNEQRNLSQRPQHDQRQTQNLTAPSLRPQANPLGSIVEPAPAESNEGMRLAEALGAASEGTQQAMPFLEQYAEGQYEKGQMDYLRGEDSPQSKNYWRVKAFEQTKGENIARDDYQHELKNYYQDNRDSDPQEFQEGLKELTKEYMEGHTENWIAGFAPVAHTAEQKILSQFQDSIIEEQSEKERKELRSLIRGETEEAINGLVDAEYDDISTVEELLNEDTMNYKTFFNQESNKEKLNGRLQDVLKAAQDRGEAFGMKKQEVSDMFIDYTIRTAMEEGVPEILDVLYKEDEDGIALVDTKRVDDIEQARVRTEENIEQRIEAARKEADQERQRKWEARTEMARKEQEEQRRNIYNESFNALQEIELLAQEDPEEARNQAKKIRSEYMDSWGELDVTRYKELMEMSHEVIGMTSGGADEKEDHPEIVAEFKSSLVRNESLDTSELREAWKNGNLTDSTYQDLLVQNTEVQKGAEEKSQEQVNEMGREYDGMINNVTDFIVDKVEDGVYEDEELASAIPERIKNDLMNYRMNNDMDYPDPETFIEDMVNPAIRAQGVTYDDILTYSFEDERQTEEAEEGAQIIDRLNELGEANAFEELGELQDDAESESGLASFGRSVVGESYGEAFEQELTALGFDEEEGPLTEKDFNYFRKNPPQKFFNRINTAINEEDVSMDKVFTDLDELVEDTDLTKSAAKTIKAGTIAQEIVNPLFNDRMADKKASEVPSFSELQNDLRDRMDQYGLNSEQQSIATSYLTNLWREATGRND